MQTAQISYFTSQDITVLQQEIMHFIDRWIKTKKTLVPKQDIVAEMVKQDAKEPTVIYALSSLLKKGYIRRAQVYPTKKTLYVRIRTI